MIRPPTSLPSPGGHYVAVVGPPQEVWGSYLADFALCAVASPSRLLYHRAGYSAHALGVHQTDQPIFLYWSQAGDWLTLYEYKRQQTYEVVFICLATAHVYRVPATNKLLAQLPALSQSGPQLVAFLQKTEHVVGAPPLDSVPPWLRPR